MSFTEPKTIKSPLSKAQNTVLKAFLQGHIITIEKEAYCFAEYGDTLMTENSVDGDIDWIAQETGIFKRFYSFDAGVKEYTPQNATGCRWVLAAVDIAGVLSLIRRMSDDEVAIAISNYTLTNVKGRHYG